jgi:predicted porin
MKKSLIALAALAATASFAQSSVTIYGALDVGVVKLTGQELGINNTNASYPASQSTTGLLNSFARQGTGTNHMGFRGIEDLGGGMYAGFDLQTGGLDTSNGNPGLAFSRESHLKLGSKSWGDVKIGRTVSTFCSVGCSFDYNFIGAGNAYALVGLSPAINKGSSRRSDLIEWTSVPMNGFTARLGTQLRGDQNADGSFATSGGAAYSATSTGGGASTTVSNYKNVYVAGLNYVNGPIRAALAIETAANDSNAMRNAQYAAAEYNFGFAKVAASYMVNTNKGGAAVPKASGSGTDDRTGLYALSTATGVTTYGKGYTLGTVVPVGSWNFGVQYADNTEQKVKATELFAQYALSKRTTIYAYTTSLSGAKAVSAAAPTANTAAASADNVSAAAQNAIGTGAIAANPSITAIGIRHTF